MMPVSKSPASRMQAELRWAASAHALISRPDRVSILLNRLEQLPTRRANFEAACTEYLDLATDEAARESAQRDFDQFFELTDELVEAGAKYEKEARHSNTLCESPQQPSQLALLGRLPTMDFPRFSGRLRDWMGFIDIFNSLVDARRDLTPAQKMAYLLSSLEGEALGVVGHLKLTDDSYPTARELLGRRYGNVRRLADAHMMQLLSLPILTDQKRLREEILDPVVVATNALRRLDLPVDQWSFLLLHMVLSRLPLDLRIHFEERYGGDGANYIPPFKDLIKFLEEQSRHIENAVGTALPVGSSTRPAPRARKPDSVLQSKGASKVSNKPSGTHEVGRWTVPNYSGLAATESPLCSYCHAPTHRTLACPKFLSEHVKIRRAIAKERRWCFSCLELHLQRDCPQKKPCPHCEGAHLLILCLNGNGASRQGMVENSPSRDGGARSDLPAAAPAVRPTCRFERGSSPRQADVHLSIGGGGSTSSTNEGGFTAAQPTSRPFSSPLAEWPRLERYSPLWSHQPSAFYAAPQLAYSTRHARPLRADAWVHPSGGSPPRVVEVPQESHDAHRRFEESPGDSGSH